MQPANTVAPAGMRPPVTYVECDAPSPITDRHNLATDRGPARDPNGLLRPIGTETRPPRYLAAFFHRPAEGHRLRGGDVANGLHVVVGRPSSGYPLGSQEPWPVAQRKTLFRAPAPWDRGTTRAPVES